MFSLHLCSKKKDQMKVYGESFHGSFKRIKQEDQTQAKLEKSENAKLIKPDVQLYLDTKVHSETFEDHRATCLDLELNLCSSSSSVVKTIMKKEESSKGKTLIMSPSKKRKSGDRGGVSQSPSWLAFECDNDTDDEQKKQEMVTTVCMKCHMLVMLCKSTLVCPNCKFTHPDDHRPLSLFKLLC
ncbi:hypothetical protein N665_0165s0011 [Sinapis alba]|nr:hypothetical protein N665_0165s0011 [Sinapis alba]